MSMWLGFKLRALASTASLTVPSNIRTPASTSKEREVSHLLQAKSSRVSHRSPATSTRTAESTRTRLFAFFLDKCFPDECVLGTFPDPAFTREYRKRFHHAETSSRSEKSTTKKKFVKCCIVVFFFFLSRELTVSWRILFSLKVSQPSLR